ncbi:fibrinogen-like protein A [Argopecten irradians]|uniref:fibrinogen-like protein A n=1 Tax=Argopecten irradians TaxID=31199 RepID=UPI0037178A7D
MAVLQWYLILISVVLAVFTEGKRSSYVMYRNKQTTQTRNYEFKTLANISTLQACATKCHFDSECNAFTFQEEKHLCEFLQNGSFPYALLGTVYAAAPPLCHDLSPSMPSGVYSIAVTPPDVVQVYCDMTTVGGRWAVIQNRYDGSVDFRRTWEEYKVGFGDPNSEYWLGNENIHLLTSLLHEWELRIEIADQKGTLFYANFDAFSVGNETSDYMLAPLNGYSGNMYLNHFQYNQSTTFSTEDNDNDGDGSLHCAKMMGGGWWYMHSLTNQCGRVSLNGRYSLHQAGAEYMHWESLTADLPVYTPLMSSRMMIRPAS